MANVNHPWPRRFTAINYDVVDNKYNVYSQADEKQTADSFFTFKLLVFAYFYRQSQLLFSALFSMLTRECLFS